MGRASRGCDIYLKFCVPALWRYQVDVSGAGDKSGAILQCKVYALKD